MPMTQSDTSTTLLHEAAEAATGDVVLDFPGGLPGFPGSRQFRLEALAPELEPFCRMRSVGAPDLCFTLVPPGMLVPDYSVEIDEDHVASLGLQSADDAVVLAIVTLPPPPQPPTVNLLGPIVVNRTTGVAAQVVQHRSNHPVAFPCLPAASSPEVG